MSHCMEGSKLVEQYRELGYVGPLRAFSADELNGVGPAVLGELNGKYSGLLAIRNRHLDWEVARRLVSSAAMLDAACQVLGPELVLWRSNFFIGKPGRGIGWHQDEYQTLLADPVNQVSLHLGITAASEDNCVMIVPGTHVLTREQLAEMGFNFIRGSDKGAYGTPNFWRGESSPGKRFDVVKMTVRPGEFFLFHPSLVHASRDNTTPVPAAAAAPAAAIPPRVGLGLRITVPRNQILPGAFAETASRGDYPVRLKHSDTVLRWSAE